jgi:tRNA threonylcarbamoyladenosine biosynthesis protein TsaE
MENFLTTSPAQTKKVGKDLAKEIKKAGPKAQACLLVLEGDLGGGKTTFLQGFAIGLGIEEKILSPTFVIMKRFKIQGSEFKNFYHLDCYRLKDAKDVLCLGFEKILSDKNNIIAIEWPEKIKEALPKDLIKIQFEFIDDKRRKLKISK